VIELAGEPSSLEAALAGFQPALALAEQGGADGGGFRRVTLTTQSDAEFGEPLLRALTERGLRVRAISRANPTLEDVFLAATRRSWDTVDPKNPQ